MLDLTKIPFHPSPNFSSRRGKAVTHLVFHTTQGAMPGSLQWLCNPKSQVSAHYVIDKAGTITQMVKLTDKAWHVGNANPFTVGVEHEGFCNKAGWFTPEMRKASVELFAALCKHFSLPVDRIIGHSDPLMKRYGNNHHDPNMDLSDFRKEVQALLDG